MIIKLLCKGTLYNTSCFSDQNKNNQTGELPCCYEGTGFQALKSTLDHFALLSFQVTCVYFLFVFYKVCNIVAKNF